MPASVTHRSKRIQRFTSAISCAKIESAEDIYEREQRCPLREDTARSCEESLAAESDATSASKQAAKLASVPITECCLCFRTEQALSLSDVEQLPFELEYVL